MNTTKTDKDRKKQWGEPFAAEEMDQLLSHVSEHLNDTDRLETIHEEWFDQIRELQFKGNHTSPL